ncbi:MAG: hypothetical protein K9M55_08750 [Candidatus Marinimicrobia bacterium]|nr:hypothetical protein [Candidatus Neomarinimicrobiota bacterium]MCF7922777.1 hypothetical protein [Candidatus Neomarinimicrobiota bacterium]
MLAIHISRDTIKFAQLVNFKGTPFIESLGKVSLNDQLVSPDMTNSQVIMSLAEQISKIRNSAEFPDNSTHLVIDSDWFPMGIHPVDVALAGNDLNKYLKWYMKEMLDSSLSQYVTIHQELNRSSAKAVQYLSMAIPQSFDSWLERIISPSELELKKVITDMEAIGNVLTATKLLDFEGGIQVVLENRENTINCHMFQNHEFSGLFHGSLNWDYRITLDHVRGDAKLINLVKEAIERAVKGKRDPDNVITNLFYFSSSGDPSLMSNLENYEVSCQKLHLDNYFNFRDPDTENIDEYAVVLGALNVEIQERFSEV